MRRAILIILVIGITAGTTFDDLVQKVRAKDDTTASPEDIVLVPGDEASILDNKLGDLKGIVLI